MANGVHCPQCGCDIELSTLMREQFAVELRASMQVELKAEYEARVAGAAAEADTRLRAMHEELEGARRKVASASANEAALLKMKRELEARAQDMALDVERRIDEEAKRIREQEVKAARERFGREADQRVQAKEAELAEVRGKLATAAAHEGALLKKERELDEQRSALTLDVERRVLAQAQQIREQEAEAAKARYARDAAERARVTDQALAEAKAKLVAAAEREASVLQKHGALEEQQRLMAVEFELRMAEKTKHIRDQEAVLAEKRVELERGEHQLREQEHRQQIEGLERTVSELQRRMRQGSQQTQGEAQEVVLRDLLEQAFSGDRIEDVPKGINGADVFHRVRGGAEGRDCGTIVWESKRTKTWSDDWLPKLRDDQRTAGAACAVIVSQALPAEIRHFGMKDGVWVSAWPYATALGAALRASLVEVALAKRMAEGRGEKMQMLFEYVSGVEFRNRVEGFVEAFREMHEDLESEKRAMRTLWNKRARLMERASDNITAFWGDVQGITGRHIQALPALSLEPRAGLLGEGFEEAELAEEDQGNDPDHLRLKEILFMLVPVDGSGMASGTLAKRFLDQALTELSFCANESDYLRCRDALVSEGRLRKGRGKGGAVSRVVAGGARVEQAALEWSEPAPAARSSASPAARQSGGN